MADLNGKIVAILTENGFEGLKSQVFCLIPGNLSPWRIAQRAAKIADHGWLNSDIDRLCSKRSTAQLPLDDT